MISLYESEQACPYCGYVDDEHRWNWSTEEDSYVECNGCDKCYTSTPQYTFEGFEIKKLCKECGDEYDKDDTCCGEEPEND